MIHPDIEQTIIRIQTVANDCNRSALEIHTVAVTKTQEPEVLRPLHKHGLCTFGENRIEHLQMMAAQAPANSSFHFIGRLQSRQIKSIVPHVECIHSLASLKHLRTINSLCTELNKRMQVFIQVNTSGETQKDGIQAEELSFFLEQAQQYTAIDVCGLMCMAPKRAEVGDSAIHKYFAQTRMLAEAHKLPRLSMGMSGDYDIAIQEGATDLRIGSVFFI